MRIQLTLLSITLFFFACGTSNQPADVRRAISVQEKQFNLKFNLTDPDGKPLTDVLVNADIRRKDPDFLWGRPIKKTFVAGPTLDLDASATSISLTLSKPGYQPLNLDIDPDRFSFGDIFSTMGSFPGLPPSTLILHPDVGESPGRYYMTETLRAETPCLRPRGEIRDVRNWPNAWAVDLDAFAAGKHRNQYELNPDQPLPPNCLCLSSTYRIGPRGPENQNLILRMTAPDGGFIRFVPNNSDVPLNQMRQAPADGYQSSITLSPGRVAQMTLPPDWSAIEYNDVYKHHEFYYFRANGRYGRIHITRSFDTGFDVTIEMERTGSRDIPSAPH